MGTALARALVQAGRQTTVWNRTHEKALPLVAQGAQSESSLAAAARASSVIVVCVADYAVTRDLLSADDVMRNLTGRTVVQLSTGTPREAREAETFLNGLGCSYIDGAILGGPHHIGTDKAIILIGGEKAAFERCKPLLGALTGDIRYLGETIGAAAALDLAWLCQRFGLFIGMTHGARICESEGVGLDLLASLFPEGDRARAFAEVIHAGAYNQPAATLNAWYAALRRVQRQALDAGIDHAVPDFIAGVFERAVRAGCGEQDVAALAKVLRDRKGL